MQYAERLHNSAGYPGPWQHDHGQYYLLVSAVAIASSTSTILGPVVTTQISMLHGTVSIPQPSFSHVPAVFYPQAPQQPDHPPHTQTQGMSRRRANSNATFDHLFYPAPSRHPRKKYQKQTSRFNINTRIYGSTPYTSGKT